LPVLRNPESLQQFLQPSARQGLRLLVVVKLGFQLALLDGEGEKCFLKVFEGEGLPSFFLLVVFEQVLGGGGIGEGELLAEGVPAFLLEALVLGAQLVLVVLASIAEEGLEFFLVVAENVLSAALLINVAEQFLVQFLHLVFILLLLQLLLHLLLQLPVLPLFLLLFPAVLLLRRLPFLLCALGLFSPSSLVFLQLLPQLLFPLLLFQLLLCALLFFLFLFFLLPFSSILFKFLLLLALVAFLFFFFSLLLVLILLPHSLFFFFLARILSLLFLLNAFHAFLNFLLPSLELLLFAFLAGAPSLLFLLLLLLGSVHQFEFGLVFLFEGLVTAVLLDAPVKAGCAVDGRVVSLGDCPLGLRGRHSLAILKQRDGLFPFLFGRARRKYHILLDHPGLLIEAHFFLEGMESEYLEEYLKMLWRSSLTTS
jgi:hypothetical protein